MSTNRKTLMRKVNQLRAEADGIDLTNTCLRERLGALYCETDGISGDTPINFGRLKGLPHSVLLQPECARYRKWLYSLGKDFTYYDTVEWVRDNLTETDSSDVEDDLLDIDEE